MIAGRRPGRGLARRAGALGAGLALILAAGVPVRAVARLGRTSVSGVTVARSTDLARHRARYTVRFRTSPTGALARHDRITVRFPSGTRLGSRCGAVEDFAGNVTVNGAVTSVSSIVSCLTLRIDVPIRVGASRAVTVVLGSARKVIRNPGAGTYAAAVSTTGDPAPAGSETYTITPQHRPVADGQAVTPEEDTPVTLTLTATDADGDALSFSVVPGSGPAHGTLGPLAAPACSGGGPTTCSSQVTYTPAGDYSGPDGFQFRVRDGIVSSLPATVSLTVRPVNDAPAAADDDATVPQDGEGTTVPVLSNDRDPDGDPLTVTEATVPGNGTASCGPSSCRYTPAPGFTGTDSFTYTVEDPAGARDAAAVRVEVLPPEPAGVGGSVTIDLCARPGTTLLPDGTAVDIWGFAVGTCEEGAEPTLPGPVLGVDTPTITAGNEVTVVLHDQLPGRRVFLEFPGQAAREAVPEAGGPRTYTFTATDPGTYLYQSADARQALMGLVGAMVIRPAVPGRAYNGAATAYDVEAPLVLSEVDPRFNADPEGFDLVRFDPRFWLINGRAFPETAPLSAAPGQRVLLRYVNAGSLHHTMALLGSHERVVGRDGYPVRYPYEVDAETIPAGGTLDAIIAIPSGTPEGTRLWLYNRQLHLDNAGDFPGGMMTFLEVASPLRADLEVKKRAGSATITAGEWAEFTIEVANNGPDEALGVTLDDRLPDSGLAWLEVPDRAACTITDDPAGDLLHCDLGTMASGAFFTVTVKAQTDEGDCGVLANEVRAGAENEPPEFLGNNSASASVTVGCPSPDRDGPGTGTGEPG